MNRWGLKLEGLGSMVAELTDEELELYLFKEMQFRIILGRFPDYFEERDIIKQVRKEKRCAQGELKTDLAFVPKKDASI